jgi:hypothetical protein
MLYHLQICSLVPEIIRQKARAARHRNQAIPYSVPSAMPTHFVLTSPALQLDTSLPTSAVRQTGLHPDQPSQILSPLGPFSPALPNSSALFSPMDNVSDSGSVPGSSVASNASTPILTFTSQQLPQSSLRATAFCRSFSQPALDHQAVHFHDPITPTIPFSPDRQARFESRLCRVVASAGIPLTFTSNIEWMLLVDEFIPGIRNVKRDALTRRVLPGVLRELRKDAKASVMGCDATVQCDGWSGLNGHHLIAFMIASNSRVSV